MRALFEGAFTARMLIAGAWASGTVGLLLHGRSSEQFVLGSDPLALACGCAAAAGVFMEGAPPRERLPVVLAGAVAGAAWGVSGGGVGWAGAKGEGARE